METADNRGNEVIAKATILVTDDNSFKPLSSMLNIVKEYVDINKTGKRKACNRPLQPGQDLPWNS